MIKVGRILTNIIKKGVIGFLNHDETSNNLVEQIVFKHFVLNMF